MKRRHCYHPAAGSMTATTSPDAVCNLDRASPAHHCRARDRHARRPRSAANHRRRNGRKRAAASSPAPRSGIGALALASCCREKPPRLPESAIGGLPGSAAFRAQGQALHLSPPGRRAAADGDLRLQAENAGHVRQGPARVDPQRPAAHHHDQRPDAFSHRALRFQVRAVRQIRRVGLANCCPTPRAWWTTSPSSAACTPRRSITSRRITFFQTGTDRRPAVHRFMDQLWPGQHESEPAHVRGAAGQAQQSQGQRAGDFRAPVERRFSVRRSIPA